MRYKNILLSVLIVLFLSTNVFATTYYVCGNETLCDAGEAANTDWETGNDSNACTSRGAPCLTIKAGVGKMSSSDTLVIGDGTYTGTSNCLNNGSGWEWDNGIPDGDEGYPTIIMSENDFGVTIDGEGTQPPFAVYNWSWGQIEGINFTRGGGGGLTQAFVLGYSDHCKIFRSTFSEGQNNSDVMSIRYGSYNLVEDCAAWGQGRYVFSSYDKTGDHAYNIFRRCVARWDYDDIGDGQERPKGAYSLYWSDGTVLQNCIAIDGNGINEYLGATSFYAPNGGSDFLFDSCIALNNDGSGLLTEQGSDSVTITNSILWDINSVETDNYNMWIRENTNTVVNNCTIGNVDTASTGMRWQTTGTIYDTIFYDHQTYALYVYGETSEPTHDYNLFYANTDNFYQASAQANELTAVNPLISGLLYLPRIETGSALKTAGQSGDQIGAEILYKLGVSGTLYGETGWNTLTGYPLWPWTYEDEFRSLMRTYSLHGVDGDRGFCADGETLTHYIWNYLGNGGYPYGSISAPKNFRGVLQ